MRVSISDLTSRDAVLEAIKECDRLGRDEFLKHYGFRRSRLYPLRHTGRVYDSKAIAAVAYGLQHGQQPPRPKNFSGGIDTVVPALKKLGFFANKAGHPAQELVVGSTYQRSELLERYGGQFQRGIWTPKEFPVVFIFSGESGETYGYQDGWNEDDVFQYTGEGQVGPMTFEKSGNRAIRDHRSDGKDLLLFQDIKQGTGVRYVGLFECASWKYVDGVDKHGDPRKIIVFGLVPVSSASDSTTNFSQSEEPTEQSASLEELRLAAYAASNTNAGSAKSSSSKTIWRERSRKVRDYVLARANGNCESCGKPAPFLRKDGAPYLEPHHTKRLADDGPDHPRWVAAVCPNCHRRIHSGEDGPDWNVRLQQKLELLEPDG